MKLIQKKKTALAWMALTLSACGGGGGSQQAAVDPDTVLNGYVMDGPLVGAKVCLDTNANWVCDATEPSAVSAERGAFALSIAPLKYQDVSNKQIIAEVGPDALDEDTGMTLNAAGQAGYVLASWGGARPILSPINTLLTLERFSTSYNPNLDVFNVADLLTQSGLSKTAEHYFDATAPLTSTERLLAQSTGRQLASMLSTAKAKLKTDAASVYVADNSQLGARAAELVLEAMRNTRSASANETEAQGLQRMQAALASIALTPSVEALNKRATTPLMADAALSVLRQGLHDANGLGSSPRSWLQYKTMPGSVALLSSSRYRYISSAWARDTAYAGAGVAGYHLIYNDGSVDQSPVFRKISVASPVLATDGSGLKENFVDANNTQAHELVLVSKSVSALAFDALPEFTSFSGTFAPGQSVYRLRRKALKNEYLFDSVATFFTSLTQFRNSPQTCYEGICWSITQQASGNTDALAGRMTFRTTSSAGSLSLGEGRFVEDTVAGVQVLRMISVPIEVQNRSQLWSAKDGRYLSFADIDSKLWSGKYVPAGAVWYSNYLLDLTGLNTVLSSAQINAFAP
jgi:hypothetical protein